VPDLPALRIAAVTHRYGDRLALDSVSFDVPQGCTFALLGPNGGGKTTLFRIVSTVLRASGGQVSIFGADVVNDAAAARRHMGVVFQSPALDPRLTVRENLVHHGHLYGLRGATLAARIDESLGAFGLGERAGDRIDRLSGGMQRRAEIAKALIPRPRLLLLDEPSTGLDPGARRDLADTLRTVRDTTGATVVLTTHLMDEAAQADRVGILHHGRMVALDTPRALVAQVGGDVLWIDAPAPAVLLPRLRDRFALEGHLVEGRVRIERAEAAPFIPRVVEAFPGEIDAITYARPTLDDVFVHFTGERLN
jgi:ABC-2 type transport system ATP-binding protein